MDVLDEILGSLRLTGGVVIDGGFAGDFCVSAEFTPDHCAPFFAMPERLISYHYVRSGRLIVEVEGLPPVSLAAGSIAIVPRNDVHTLASRTGLAPAAVDDVGWITADGVHRVSIGTEGEEAKVWCGFLGTASSSAHPLLDALPPLLTLDLADGDAQWLDSSMRFVAERSPPPETVARLAELFLSQAVRNYVAQLPADAQGWLKGLADPAVGKALAIIHSRYAEDIDVQGIAREVGVSRTVLGDRFADLLGEPPMRYCARWRMRVAANLLRDSKRHAANVAYEVGFHSEAAFNRAFKREYGEPPATWQRHVEGEEAAQRRTVLAAPTPPQQIQYCVAADGTRLAYSVTGAGPPLVKTANWLNHIEYDWASPLWRHWIAEFTTGHSLIRYDERGNGLSDWNSSDLSLDAFVDDLECVVDSVGVDQFDLLAISQGAAVAVAFCVRHPQRVRRLIICNGFAAGWSARGDPEEIARRRAMMTLTETGWGADNPAYRQLFTNTYIPEATPKQMGWFNEMQRKSASPQNAARIQEALGALDVRDRLAQVTTPTLIFHSRDDQAVPFSQGELLASGIHGSSFVALECRNHILLEHDPAWRTFVETSRAFLASGETPRSFTPFVHGRDSEVRGKCAGPDGARIAFAMSGAGFPLVKASNWMTHLDHDWTSPVYGHWLDEFSRNRRLVRADMRGFGLSEWEPREFTFEAMVGDLGAVVEAAGVEQCDLLAVSHGCPIAIAFAARNPERVRNLILVNSFAAGWRVRADPEELAYRESLLEMNRRQPSFRRSLLGEMFITLYFPSASEQLIAWHNELFQTLGPVASMQTMIDVASWIDVRGEVAKVRAPTLVCHSRQDGNAPLTSGQWVAEQIAGSRFEELDSANHILLADEPAWPAFCRHARQFLSEAS
jgi:pimeloyl-ACP methyl ester carboxylesterase/AraC-like DNA-binding protein